MIKELSTLVDNRYESPICDVVDIKTEGVLCSSFETPEEYDKPYEW